MKAMPRKGSETKMGRGFLPVILFGVLLFGLFGLVTGCGGGGGGGTKTTPPPSTGNVLAISVNSGVLQNYANGVFASVTVCAPGSTNCQTINAVLVDTGSEGLRVLSSALSVSLPQQTDGSSNPIAECLPFVAGFTWGPVQMADIKLAGEVASAVPLQVINDHFAAIPASCSSRGADESTLQALGANGILGVGPFRQDCGPGCSSNLTNDRYYACPGSGCVLAAEGITQQVQNPVWMFPTDNNGTLISLPSVAAAGAASISGSLIFGIGTQSNNALPNTATVFPLDPFGNFTTIYNGQSYTSSFIDSGSNAFFFLDTATTGIATCNDAPFFYCPPSTMSLMATNKVTGGAATNVVNFSIANADSLFANNPTGFVFGNLGGPNSNSFDWGLPFFYGRNVFTAIEGQSTPGGTGTYWAY
jgi:hypothetical protein